MKEYIDQKIDTATRDICSVAVTGAPKSKVEDILRELVDSVAQKTVEEVEKIIEEKLKNLEMIIGDSRVDNQERYAGKHDALSDLRSSLSTLNSSFEKR